MRELKFRGKRIDTGDWVYGDYFKTPLSDENSGTTPEAGWFFLTGETRHCIGSNGVAFVVNPSTIGQFTGRKDKAGKEIYEGMMVRKTTQMSMTKPPHSRPHWGCKERRVVFHEGAFVFKKSNMSKNIGCNSVMIRFFGIEILKD